VSASPFLINGFPAELAPSAAVAILHASLPEPSILLMRRAQRAGDPWSGHWSFPGGRRELEDLDLLDTALRELREECGIHLERDQLTERLEDDWAGRVVGHSVMVASFLFRIPDQIQTTLDHTEAAEAVWMPMSFLLDLSLHGVRVIPGIPPDRKFPAFDLRGTLVWGFTYRVLCQWAGVPVAPEGLIVKESADNKVSPE
jgi:8-oxo-dGTP diphosphatase